MFEEGDQAGGEGAFENTRRDVLKAAVSAGVGMSGLAAVSGTGTAAVGDELGVVDLPDNVESAYPWELNCALGSAFDGTYFSTLFDGNARPDVDDLCVSDVLQIYEPPADGDGTATKVAEKHVVDGDGEPVPISALAWDPGRERYWAAWDGDVWTIDRGDPTTDEDAVAQRQFGGLPDRGEHVTGLAYDGCTDTVWYAEETARVWQFNPDGTQTETSPVQPEPDRSDLAYRYVSGIVVGPELDGRPTLYVAYNGMDWIFRAFADTGEFISEVVSRNEERSEGLTCDPVTYAPKSALLLKNTHYDGTYTAFEVESGTCEACLEPSLEVPVAVKPGDCPTSLPAQSRGKLPVAIAGTDDVDVTEIDPASLELKRAGTDDGVAPDRWSYEDVTAPSEPYVGKSADDCVAAGPDGVTDLTLTFDVQAVVETLGSVEDGETVVLRLDGALKAAFDATPIVGEDVAVLKRKGR